LAIADFRLKVTAEISETVSATIRHSEIAIRQFSSLLRHQPLRPAELRAV
jgi:hypothetical protein